MPADSGSSRLLGRVHAPGLGLILLALAGCSSEGDREAAPPAGELDRDRLGALGYVSWSGVRDEDRDKSGVTRFDPARSRPGLNLWNSLPRRSAVLMDAEGEIVHTWERETGGEWGHVELLENGDLLVFHQGPDRLIRLDWDSELVWERPMLAHHDADVSPDGTIVVLDERRKPVRAGADWVLVAKEGIVFLGDDGAVLRRIPLFDVLGDRIDLETAPPYGEPAEDPRMRFLDPLHVNTLTVLREDRDEIFRAGRALVCSRSLGIVGVVDLEREELVWSWGEDELDRPHQPVLSEDGTLFIFDNGPHRGWSRIVEVQPATGEIVWEYRGDPPESFFSHTMGGIQLLPGGNILVSESTRGRAFEITRDGEIVWEFFNPDVEVDGQERATFYRMTRIDEGMFAQLLR